MQELNKGLESKKNLLNNNNPLNGTAKISENN